MQRRRQDCEGHDHRGEGYPITSRERFSVAVLLLGLAAFVVRGPLPVIQHLEERGDFASPFIGATAWAKGIDPYASASFWQMWRAAGGRPLPETDTLDSRPPYLLSTFVAMAPLTPLPYRAARVAWMVVTIGLVALAVVALACALPGDRGTWFAAIAIAMSPLHAGIRTGTASIPAIALLMLSVWASTRGRAFTAGACIALASMKPQLALPFVAYHLVRRNYRVAGFSVGVWLVLMAIGATRLAVAGVPWMVGYVENMRLVLGDPKNVFTSENPLRFQTLNLQPLVESIAANATVSNMLAWAIGAALLIGWWVLIRKMPARSELLEVGALSAIFLLPIYHRFYDAWLLVLPLCWALSLPDLRAGRAVFVPVLPFLIPVVGFAEWLIARGSFPSDLANRMWWQASVMSLDIWALLIYCLSCYSIMWNSCLRDAETRSCA